MWCTTLTAIYGKDTRAAQWLNVLFSLLWAGVLSARLYAGAPIALPPALLLGGGQVLGLTLASMTVSSLGFITTGRRHQVFKFFGLSLGVVVHGALANCFFSSYPPLDVMLLITFGLLVWFLGALLYIMKCEGFDGTYSGKH